jgi:hypothetical protein
MENQQAIGIDLPLKILKDQTGQTWLSYNEPEWLARRHGLSPSAKTVRASAQTLGADARRNRQGRGFVRIEQRSLAFSSSRESAKWATPEKIYRPAIQRLGRPATAASFAAPCLQGHAAGSYGEGRWLITAFIARSVSWSLHIEGGDRHARDQARRFAGASRGNFVLPA